MKLNTPKWCTNVKISLNPYFSCFKFDLFTNQLKRSLEKVEIYLKTRMKNKTHIHTRNRKQSCMQIKFSPNNSILSKCFVCESVFLFLLFYLSSFPPHVHVHMFVGLLRILSSSWFHFTLFEFFFFFFFFGNSICIKCDDIMSSSFCLSTALQQRSWCFSFSHVGFVAFSWLFQRLKWQRKLSEKVKRTFIGCAMHQSFVTLIWNIRLIKCWCEKYIRKYTFV